jgi:hypothetical protein
MLLILMLLLLLLLGSTDTRTDMWMRDTTLVTTSLHQL